MSGLRKLTRTQTALFLITILLGVSIASVSLAGRAVRSALQAKLQAAATHPAVPARSRKLPAQKPRAPRDTALEVEPNNTRATATALPLDGQGFATGVGSITAGDEDYWLVVAPTNDDSIYALVETGTTPNADTILEVTDGNGNVLETDDDDGSSTNCQGVLYSSLSSTVFSVGGGTCMSGFSCVYYLRVRAKSAAGTIPTYKLLVIGTGGGFSTELDAPNDDAGTAQTILGSDESIAGVIGDAEEGDVDYYAINVGGVFADRTLYLSLGAADAPTEDDLVLSLIGPDGVTPIFTANSSGMGSNGDPPTETFCYQLPDAGTYYIRVETSGQLFTGPRPQARRRPTVTGYRLLAALLPSVPVAELAVTKTGPTTAAAGQNISYTITVQSNGPDEAVNPFLSDTLPANTTFQSLVRPPLWDCMTPPVGGTGTVTCGMEGLAVGATASFVLTVQINAGTPNGTVITNTATITSDTFDTVPGNNSATVTTTVGGQTDLALTKTAPATVAPGATFNYSFTLANNGNTASNVSFTDALPANTTFVSNTTPTGFTCTTPAPNTNGTVACTRSSFPSGSSVTFTITARVNASVQCDTVITNTATVNSATPDLNPANNTSMASSTASTQSDLALTATADRAAAPPDQSVTYTLTVINNGPSPSLNTVVTDNLPAAFTAEAATTSVGTCTGVGTNTVTCSLGTLTVGATATIRIQAHVPETCQPTSVANTATVSNRNCGPDPNPANNTATTPTTVQLANLGPGACFPASSGISGTRPGSILFAGLFASGAGAGGNGGDTQNNTRVNLTNVHPTLPVVVHLFFVDGDTCSIADAFMCLTANQTTSFLMSDLDPGTRGYMMMIAVDGPPGYAGGHNTGCPISFNYLIGNAQIKFTNSPRRDLDLESESVPSEFGSPVPTCNPNEPTAVLVFDDSPTGYSRLPAVLALDNIPSRADGNDTVLMLGRIDGDWANGLRPIGNIAGLLFNDTEAAYSFGFNVNTCFLRSSLSGSFPRTAPRFEQVIPAGRSGWMKLWSTDGAALVGAMHNRNDNSRSTPNAFEGGHNLHILRLLPRAVITVPVFPPSCAF